MKKIAKRLMIVAGIIIIIWVILTLWVEAEGPARIKHLGNATSGQAALIVYDPDPIYNLDEQVGETLAAVLAENGWKATLATVAAAKKEDCSGFELYILCANTYNWRPDWAITRFVKKYASLKDKRVAAITLGAGSTKAAQKAFERAIVQQGAIIAASCSLWLLKPNDETRMKEKNVAVAKDMIREWAINLIKGE